MMEEYIINGAEAYEFGDSTAMRISTVSTALNERSHSSSAKTYTVEDAVESAGFGWFQMRILIICGIISSADAMEMLLLSVLGPALRCEWHLNSTQIAFITTVVFVGYFFGSPLWGMMSDKYGRWTIFCMILSIISYFSFLTAFSANYVWVIVLRSLVGFGIGGASIGFTLLSEYLPSKYRAKVLIAFHMCWSLGSSFEITLAYFVLPLLGWRWLVGITSLPVACFLLLTKFVPESARFQLAAGQEGKALETIKSMFRLNKKSMMKGVLTDKCVSVQERGNVSTLVSPQFRRTTLTLLIIWFGAAFSYYGIVLVSAEFFRFHSHCFAESEFIIDPHNISSTFVDSSCCKEISNDDYRAMLISSFGEFFVIPVNIMLIDWLGRRYTLAVGFASTGLFFCLLGLCVPKVVSTIFMFCIRAFASGIFNVLYIYTSEVYPTTVRALGIGVCSAMARFGSMSTPFVAQVIMPDVSVFSALLIYASVALVCVVSALTLPIETKGRPLQQTCVVYNVQEAEVTFNEANT